MTTSSRSTPAPRRLRLQTQLLILLLGFGALPVAISVIVGYTVSRTAMVEQAQKALIELTDRQADYLGNEIRRQHLLLRTITGQFRPGRNHRQKAVCQQNEICTSPDIMRYYDSSGRKFQ